MITKTWKIDGMQVYPQHAGQSNVVKLINWRVYATDGTHTATVYSTINVTYTEGDPYTPYEQLTEEQVVEWVKTTLGAETVAGYEANVEAQLEYLINPPVIQLANPW